MESMSLSRKGISAQEKVRDLFSRLAPQYDLGNALISFGCHRAWKRRALLYSGKLNPGAKMLDGCTGTGDLAFLAKRICAEADVVGVDFSRSMLDVANRRAARLPEKYRPKFEFADLTALSEFATGSLDLVSVSFGLRNIPERGRALSAIHRVLAPGGVLVVLELAKPVRWWIAPSLFLYMWVILPFFSLIFRGNPREYLWLAESLRKYPDVTSFARELEGCGFARISVERMGLGAVSLHRAEKSSGFVSSSDKGA